MIEEVEKMVCYGESITPETLHADTITRAGKIKEIRQIVLYFAIVELKMSLSVAGAFYNKTHATAIHAKKTISNLIYSDKIFAARIEGYRRDIRALLNLKKAVFNFAEILGPLNKELEDIEARISNIIKALNEVEPKLRAYTSISEVLKNEINILKTL